MKLPPKPTAYGDQMAKCCLMAKTYSESTSSRQIDLKDAHRPKSSPTKPKGKVRPTAAWRAKIAKALRAVNGKVAAFSKRAKVELATLAKKTPENDDWMHEIKFDGYRMLCHRDGEKVRFISRNGKDWTWNFPGLAREVAELPIESRDLGWRGRCP